MSYVIALPEILSSAGGDLQTIGSALTAAHAAAAAQTTTVAAAAADEVSEAVAALFSAHGSPIKSSAHKRRRFITSSCRR